MFSVISGLFILTFGLVSPWAQADGGSLRLLYGRHSDFWSQINDLQHNPDALNQLNSFFDRKSYGAREGLVMIEPSFTTTSPEFASQFFEQAEIGFGVHALAGGEAYNRIAPQLRGYALWDTSLDGALTRSVRRGQSGWISMLGTTFGLGRQKLIQGPATDFISKVETQNSTMFYTGLDAGLGYVSQFSDRMRFDYYAQISPTLFYSEFDDNKYEYGVKKGSKHLRWRTEYEAALALQPIYEGGFEFAGQIFGGQQPVPVRILPRTWDSVHNLQTAPSLGSLIGVGPVARIFTADRSFSAETYAGFYGGYFGAGADIQLYWFRLEGGTLGMEQTSGYRVRESRIEYISLGLNHEW